MTLTAGVHHIGLTVSDPEESAEFFTRLLGWEVVKGSTIIRPSL